MTRHRISRVPAALVGLACGALLMAGCAPASGFPGAGSAEPAEVPTGAAEPVEAPMGDAEPVEEAPAPRTQAASCEWDEPALAGASATAPTGQEGDLATVLIGAWQHTHFDSGSGFEATENDLRYVFPATDELWYCQHVPGITEHAEATTTITLDGTTIALPDPHPGFEVLSWSDDAMLWQNNLEGSTYLLQRR